MRIMTHGSKSSVGHAACGLPSMMFSTYPDAAAHRGAHELHGPAQYVDISDDNGTQQRRFVVLNRSNA